MKTHATELPGGLEGATITRRTLLQAAAMAAPMVLTSSKSGAQVPPVLPPSPATTPWQQDLPRYDHVLPTTTLSPGPTLGPNVGEIGRADHQRFYELCGPGSKTGYDPDQYQLTARENPGWSFNPAYPPQPIWGYEEGDGTGQPPRAITPGPTIHARYGHPIVCRIRNALPAGHTGFGSPEISTHLHNMHTPSESDGFAGDWYSPTRFGPTLGGAGSFNDHFYPNLYAGFDEYQYSGDEYRFGDPREALGSLFYHDHTEGFTAPNVLRGLVGRYNIYDHLDTGDETTGLRLPSGNYDYPLTFGDRRFDLGGVLTFNQLAPEGVLGDKVIVNGKIEPVLRVERRRYRFRLLNAGPTRFYELYLQNKAANGIYTFTYIANDGNLLPYPLLNQFKVRFAPAERADIIIDFARFPLNTELYLVNQLVQTTTRRPDNVVAPGTRLLKFVVDREPAQPDTSAVLTAKTPLRPLRPLPDLGNVPVRQFNFERSSGMWSINGRFFNVFAPTVSPARDSMEIWELFNVDNGWQHPIHIHFEEGRILSKTVNNVSVPVPAHEQGRKDVFVVGENMRIRVLLRFRDFKGKYLMHCHNLTHEDHAMMLRWDIV